jgi:hypothetical protein
MGQEHTAISAATTTSTKATNSQEEKMEKHHDDDDDEESDIDWEDGDEELEQDERQLMATSHVQHHHHAHHLLAVDRTLAAMESAGGLRGGELEIDMTTTMTTTSPVAAQQDSRTLEKLRKLVHSLVDRHLPRLSLWLDGLTNADNLVLKSSALVLLPPASTERRQQLVEKLSELKRSVSSILSSAAKLDKETTESSLDGVHSNQSSAPQERTLAPRLGSTDSNNSERASLLGSIFRLQKRRRQEARSNRIQIKCKSR